MLETVKKLRWAPDIIHCQGWITQVLPLYLKKAYKDDPIFSSTKVVLSLLDDMPEEKFAANLNETILFGNIKPKDVTLSDAPDGMELAKLAATYADGIIMGAKGAEEKMGEYVKSLNVPVLPFDGASYEDGLYMDQYNSFYDSILQ